MKKIGKSSLNKCKKKLLLINLNNQSIYLLIFNKQDS